MQSIVIMDSGEQFFSQLTQATDFTKGSLHVIVLSEVERAEIERRGLPAPPKLAETPHYLTLSGPALGRCLQVPLNVLHYTEIFGLEPNAEWKDALRVLLQEFERVFDMSLTVRMVVEDETFQEWSKG